MNSQQFLEYVASFNPEYTSGLGEDLVNQAKKLIRRQKLAELTETS